MKERTLAEITIAALRGEPIPEVPAVEGKIDRYEHALIEIANMESGPTDNPAIDLARKTLTEEHIGKYRPNRILDVAGPDL